MNRGDDVATRQVQTVLPGLFLAAMSISQGAERDVVPSRRAALDFARQVERSIDLGDASYLQSRFDLPAMAGRVAARTEGSAADILPLLHGGLPFAREVVRTVAPDGTYRCVRVRSVKGEVRALFRLVANGGLNYHDYVLTDGETGVRVADVYIYYSGEFLSDGLRRQPGIATALGVPEEEVGGGPGLLAVYALFRAGRADDALARWEELPALARRQKTMLLLRVRIAAEAGGSPYESALAAFLEAFPDDPAADLLSIDRLLLEGDYAGALAHVERLDSKVGGDPYLDVLRADLHLLAGDRDLAWKRARRSVRRDRELREGYWALVRMSLENGDFESAAGYLIDLEGRLGVETAAVKTLPHFVDFTRSAHYERWQAIRR